MGLFENSLLHKSYPALIILGIGAPLLLLLPSIPFQNDHHCDPWYYFGLTYILSDAMHWYMWYWQLARLPAVLPGFVATHLLDGILADYALFFFYYLVSLTFLYKTVRCMLGRLTALLATIFYASQPLILANYSATYTAPAIVYDIISMYFIARAITAEDPRQKQLMVLASGIAFGAAIHAHLFIASFAFANYVIYAVYEYLRGRSISAWAMRMVLSGFLATAGLIITTIVLGAINSVVFNTSFSVIFNQFGYISSVSIAAKNDYWQSDWYLNGPKVGLFLLAALVAALNLVRTRFVVDADDDLRQRRSAISVGILVLVVTQVLYNQLGGNTMQYDFYYVFLVPYLALILFSPLPFREEPTAKDYLIITLFLIGSVVATSIRYDVFPWLYQSPSTEAYASGIVAILVAFTCAISTFSKWPRTSQTLYVAVLIALAVVIRPEQMGRGVWDGDDLAYRDTYVRIREGLRFISGLGFATPPKFWINEEQGYEELVAYPRSYLACAVSEFPQLDTSLPLRFIPGDNVIVIAHMDDLANRASQAFAKLGLAVEQTTHRIIDFNGRSYEMLVEHVIGETTPQTP